MKRTDITPPVAETTDTAASSNVTSMDTPGNAKGLSTSVQKHIGNLLKVSYQDLLTDPVPDRFASLLEQLEQAEKNGK